MPTHSQRHHCGEGDAAGARTQWEQAAAAGDIEAATEYERLLTITVEDSAANLHSRDFV